jgi:hypothetical protein
MMDDSQPDGWKLNHRLADKSGLTAVWDREDEQSGRVQVGWLYWDDMNRGRFEVTLQKDDEEACVADLTLEGVAEVASLFMTHWCVGTDE